MRANAEDVPVDLQLVDRLAEVIQETAVTLHDQKAFRVQVDFVRMGCEVVRLLRQKVTRRNHRLAGTPDT